MAETAENQLSRRARLVRHLEAHGITATAQRLEIAQIMLACPQHLSADQVLRRARAAGSRVSKATVYNTLNLFSQRGLVRAMTVEGSRQVYDSTTEAHHHFFNVDTGELTDIPPDSVVLDQLPEAPPGTRAERVDVIIRVRKAPG